MSLVYCMAFNFPWHIQIWKLKRSGRNDCSYYFKKSLGGRDICECWFQHLFLTINSLKSIEM